MGLAVYRRLWRWCVSSVYWAIAGVVCLLVLVVLALQLPWMQRRVCDGVSWYLDARYGVRVSLGGVSVGLPLRVTLHDAVVYDLEGDTLIAAGELSTSLRWLRFGRVGVGLGDTWWEHGYMRMHTDSGGVSRLKSVLARFKSRKPNRRKSSFELSISDIGLRDVRYVLSRGDAGEVAAGRVNFKHLDLSGAVGRVRHLRVVSDTVRLEVVGLDCRERSGLSLEDVGCRLSINPGQIYLGDLRFRHGMTDVRMPLLRFGFAGWESLSDFTNRVVLEADLGESRVHTGTLSYFSALPRGEGFGVLASGRVRGSVSSLRLQDVSFSAGDSTELKLSGEFIGLPDVHSTVVSIDFERLRTSVGDVEYLASGASGRRVVLPARVSGVGGIEYAGNLTGFLDNFVAYGSLRTALGSLRLDMGLEYDSVRNVHFRGAVESERIDLHGLMRDTLWGTLSGRARVDGLLRPGGDFRTEVSSWVDSIGVYGHYYRDVQFAGLATNRSFEGSFSVCDTALRMRFDGVIDMAEGDLPYFRFASQVDRADLHAMGIDRGDTVSVLSGVVDVNFQGFHLDDVDGSIVLEGFAYRNSRGCVSMGNAWVEASHSGGVRTLVFNSPFARASLETSNRYDAVLPSIKRLIYLHLPALASEEAQGEGLAGGGYHYAGEVRLDSVEPVWRVLLPSLHVASGSRLRFAYGGDYQNASFSLESDSIAYREYSVAGVRLETVLGDSANIGQLVSDRFWWKGREAREAGLGFAVSNGEYRLALRVSDGVLDTAHNALLLNTSGRVEYDSLLHGAYAVIRFDSSYLLLNRERWLFSRARIRVDPGEVSVSNFHLTCGSQRLSLGGRLSSSRSDTLVAQLSAIDLSQLRVLFPHVSLRGQLRGSAYLWRPFADLGLRVGFDVQDLRVNELYIGHFAASALWDGLGKPFVAHANNVSLGGHEDIRADFRWHPSTGHHEASVHFNRFDLASLHILMNGRAQPKGGVSGSLSSVGLIQHPNVRGELAFHDAGAYIPELNSTFTTSSSIRFAGTRLEFERFAIDDAMGGRIELDGTIDYSEIRNPLFNVSLTGSEFHLVNTNSFGQRLYYGRLVAGLQAKITGALSSMGVDVQLRALPSSSITVQLPSSTEETHNRHLIFTSTSDSISEDIIYNQQQVAFSSNLHLNMLLSLTSDTQVQLVLNSRTGDMIRARGDAHLRITSDPVRKALLIFGDYTLQRGEMQFTLEGLISKRFRIAQGSTIHFAGDPLLASADIETIYGTRASLDRLIGASDQEKYKRRIPVDCKLFFRGSLSSPKLAFSIDVPQADAETRSQLTAALNTEEKKMRQFASLLLINSFIPDSRLQSQVAGDADSKASAGVTGQEVILSSFGELISNQFNSWLGQIGQSSNTPLINLGFNYRPSAYDAELDEAEVSFSMQWKSFNVDANWEVNRHSTSNAIAGDINITKQSTLLNNLQYKAFARSNDDLIFRDLKPYTAGAGVVYSDTFNDWTELIEKIKAIFRRKRKTPAPSPEREQAP